MPSPRLPSLLAPTLASVLACLASTEAQVLNFTGRIGLYGSPEYARSTDGYETSTFYDLQGRHAVGTSARYNGSAEVGDALWMADLATASTSRIGLFSGSEFTNSSDTSQVTDLIGWREDAFAYGTSNRFNGAENAGSAAWVSLTTDRITKRVGLYAGEEFTSATGWQASTPLLDMAASYVAGVSVRYNGTSTDVGQAAWVADARSGVTTRIGFFTDAEYTLSTDGTQMSSVTAISEDGHVIGESTRYRGSESVGQAAWVANASTGTTTRIGLYSGPGFTSFGNGDQISQATQINSRGQIIGYSTRYRWSQSNGQAAWVADAATGVTTRIGLYSEPGFTSATGQQNTWSIKLTESGLIFGVSDQYRYNQYSGLGQGSGWPMPRQESPRVSGCTATPTTAIPTPDMSIAFPLARPKADMR